MADIGRSVHAARAAIARHIQRAMASAVEWIRIESIEASIRCRHWATGARAARRWITRNFIQLIEKGNRSAHALMQGIVRHVVTRREEAFLVVQPEELLPVDDEPTLIMSRPMFPSVPTSPPPATERSSVPPDSGVRERADEICVPSLVHLVRTSGREARTHFSVPVASRAEAGWLKRPMSPAPAQRAGGRR
jgi:hypothetical protein